MERLARTRRVSAPSSECPICGGSGTIFRRDPETGELFSRDCACEIKRQSLRRIERSGLGPLLERCTFARYLTPEPWQKTVKARAEAFAADPEGRWLFLGGASGCGKTHICTAVCGALMDKGLPCRYMQWRADIVQIRAKITDDEEYSAAVGPLKRVRLLYIDDLFKGGASEADLRIAFEIINARYISPEAVTVISTEYTHGQLLNLDAAIGGRIAERAGEAYTLSLGEKTNWRLRHGA